MKRVSTATIVKCQCFQKTGQKSTIDQCTLNFAQGRTVFSQSNIETKTMGCYCYCYSLFQPTVFFLAVHYLFSSFGLVCRQKQQQQTKQQNK